MDFVTGGTGLVGRHVVDELLRSGRQVRVLCRPETKRTTLEKFLVHCGTDQAGLEWIEGSLEDVFFLEDALVNCERVFHCAALVSFHRKDAAALTQINRDGTRTLVNAMLQTGVSKLIHVSSVAALGRKEGEPVHEDVPFEDGSDVSHYARSKFEAELEVWRGQEEGLKVLAVNPVIVLGAGDFDRSSSMLFTLVHKGLKWYPEGSNGFVSARDVAKACQLLAETGCWGERFVLCAENCTYQQLMIWMAQEMEVRAPSRPLRSWMLGLAWRLGVLWELVSGRRAPISRESVRNTSLHHAYRTDKLERTLKSKGVEWRYEKVEATIKATVPFVLESLGPPKR
ncbi:MAG: NAD-dependent epimerase/dehydratase family protein [Flavobacteriales bacterium]